MKIRAIHQFHPSCAEGDGVSNGIFFTQRLLRQLGFESEVFCEHFSPELAGSVKPLKALARKFDYLLFAHHSLGYENSLWLENLRAPKVLVYHNITPPHLLPAEGDLRRLSAFGRQQLKDWAPGYLGAIGVSDSNTAELRAAHYAKPVTIPLLVDTNRIRSAPWNHAVIEPLRDAANILFIGRVCENKHQLDLIDVLNELRHFADQPVRLILAGGVTSPQYLQRIKDRVNELSLQNQVVLAGKVPDSTLVALYRAADVFLCMSEHEGFGMPLIEAMLFDVPVVAHATSGVPDTMGEGGLLLTDTAPRSVAALLQTLLTNPNLRAKVIAGQRRNTRRFDPPQVLRQLAAYLSDLGVQVPHTPKTEPTPAPASKPYWQVQGPFDSSYSLAVVNRELARALSRSQLDVGLRSLEGGGDFAPNPHFLADNPDCAALFDRAAQDSHAPDIALRYCYPPHVDDMAAQTRAIHSYGWEETGFPADYAAAFNRKLDLITVHTQFVKKTLQDNGVRVPIAVTGGGVDQILHITPKPPEATLRGFRFLHVSSCFARKGVDALLLAYGKAFRQTDDVTLVIKTFPNPHNQVPEQLAQLQQTDPGYPHVVLINRDCTDEELVGWYAACHTFVAPSRGEGLGLPMVEAMLFNLPVITTAWGGQLDFCDDNTAWLCDYRFEKSRSHLGIAHSAWADPDVDHLAQLLRQVHSLTPQQRAQRTQPARQRIMADFTWNRVAQRTRQAVSALAAMPALRPQPKIGWVSTWNKRCGIAAYSSFLADAIPGDRLTIFADRHAERTAPDAPNVVRNWTAQGGENLQDLLADITGHGIQVVVVQYNFGFFTLATLARFIQQLKQVGIGIHIFFHSTADLVRGAETISLTAIADTLATADRLYVHGIADLNHFKKMGLVHNVVFFPQGILPTPANSGQARATMLLPPGTQKIIATYGYLLPHKGLQQLIQAFALLRQADPGLHLLLVNAIYPAPESEQELQACQKLIGELDLGIHVTLSTDYLSDAASLTNLQAADLIVYPYQQTQESSSAAVRMGLASGVPVAVTPLSIFDDVAEVVHRLPGTDPQAIANGIRTLLDDPQALKLQVSLGTPWRVARHWPRLSVRLLNTIDGLANFQTK